MNRGFIDVVNRHINITEEDLKLILDLSETKTYEKGEVILRAGEFCDFIAFIDKGVAMMYREDDQQKKGVFEFYMDGEFVSDYYGYIAKKESVFNINVLEKTTVTYLNRAATDKIHAKVNKWDKFSRLITEKAYSQIIDQLHDTKFMTVEERYKQLLEDRVELLQRAPLYLIASYLNTTPETLSRIRRHIATH